MRRWRRSWLTVTWSLWIIIAGGTAALACMHHPATHDDAHPLLCMDSSNPAVQSNNGSTLLGDDRRLRSPSKILIVVVHPAALGSHSTSILDVPAYELSWPPQGILLSTPASYQPVLRL
jgi:hypothetical protein